MLKFNYPDEIVKKYSNFLIFSANDRNNWARFIKKYQKYNLPNKLEDLLSASTLTLASIYINTVNDGKFKTDAETLTFLSYEKYSSEIIKFFISNRDLLKICTCVYCNMTYVNIFEAKEEDWIYLLNKAPEKELEKVLRIVEPDITKRSISGFITKIRKDKKTTLNDYLQIKGLKTRISKIISYCIKQQFDLDHFLPKDKCNLISLSINNLIPSCQVCNSRIKLVKDVYDSKITEKQLETLFPTSKNYKFSDEMKFLIETKSIVKPTSFVKAISDCNLFLKPIRANSLYEKEALLFRIEDRYRYHIIEPLTYLDKLIEFNDAYFKMLKNSTQLSDIEIATLREAVFDNYFRTKNKRIFEKLYTDIEQQTLK